MCASTHRILLLLAGFLGLTGVALGALGAHRLGPLLAQRGMIATWETGARYHLFHAVALLAVAALHRSANASAARRLAVAAWAWAVGVLLFSGSLYWFALGGPRPLVYATPLGGIALLVGWGLVLASAFSKDDTDSRR
ncbi:DUF423 domain-containing protein [Opitutus sp. ER46]|nr:DUF423 domain-containing protein [Opitutus sp. ER46]